MRNIIIDRDIDRDIDRNIYRNIDRGAHAPATPSHRPSSPASVCGGVLEDSGARGVSGPTARAG
eukprot:2296369-Prymnesium_polylepis.1